MILMWIGGYLLVGLIFTFGVYLYYKLSGRETDSGLFPIPEWVVFTTAVILFPLNIMLQLREWRYRRECRRVKLQVDKECKSSVI
ncbi:hypothetical protein PPSC2_28130 (plasmid) [Paenibacillus polymyxa SC2]|uniref:Uncharacterized protein n=1 Tax=Paenibacillus polymyxa (strain SC2) TaxID=886882 RepID=A0A0D5ZCW0_PAEPS|nr:hypothetical protein PPSC2_28130 [Paenibacillus polymyxa SC2]